MYLLIFLERSNEREVKLFLLGQSRGEAGSETSLNALAFRLLTLEPSVFYN